MKIIKMELPELGPQWFGFRRIDDAMPAIRQALENEIYTVGNVSIHLTVVEMTEEEFDALGEFEGW